MTSFPSWPTQSAPALAVCKYFEDVSGLRLNPAKSTLVPLHMLRACFDWQSTIPMKRQSFKYLGIWITLLPDLEWAWNLTPLIAKTKTDLKRWQALPLNPLGRSALVKNDDPSRFLYILQNTTFRGVGSETLTGSLTDSSGDRGGPAWP